MAIRVASDAHADLRDVNGRCRRDAGAPSRLEAGVISKAVRVDTACVRSWKDESGGVARFVKGRRPLSSDGTRF